MNNYTPRADQTLLLAKKAAQESGSALVTIEHVAIGLVKLGHGVHTNVWSKLGFNQVLFEERLRALSNIGSDVASKKPSKFTPKAKKLLSYASKLAKSLNHAYVGTEHILLAIFKVKSVAGEELIAQGLNYDICLKEVMHELDPYAPVEEPKKTEVVDFESQILTDSLGFEIYIDLGHASINDVGELFAALSDINRVMGGSGLIFVDCKDEAKVLLGVGT